MPAAGPIRGHLSDRHGPSFASYRDCAAIEQLFHVSLPVIAPVGLRQEVLRWKPTCPGRNLQNAVRQTRFDICWTNAIC